MKNLETILITGGAGFIGSNLCEHFVAKGINVICLDNFLTGKKSNIEHLLGKVNFKLVEGDIRNLELCKEITKNVDAVSHQAALGSVPRSIENPIPTNEINCQGFLNVLTAAKDNGVKRFVYASSSSVYGDSKLSPKKEDDLGKPLSPYAVSKLTNELYGKIFHELYKIETIGLRYFNVFGKNQDPNGAYAAAIPKFIQLLKKGETPIIYGDGEQTRDFTHISNVIHANERALFCNEDKAFGQAFNVACGTSFSLNQVVDIINQGLLIKGDLSQKIVPQYVAERNGDIRDSLADISKIKRLLGYNVATQFNDGINQYLADF